MKKIMKKVGQYLFAAYLASILLGFGAWALWAIMPSKPLAASEMLACGVDNNQPHAKWVLGNGANTCTVFVSQYDLGDAWRSPERDGLAIENIQRWMEYSGNENISWRAVTGAGVLPIYNEKGEKAQGLFPKIYYVTVKHNGRRTIMLVPSP
jgi:hypothetical protein